MKNRILHLIPFGLGFLAPMALGHSIQQKVSVYSDNHDTVQQRMAVGTDWDLYSGSGLLTGSGFSLNLTQDSTEGAIVRTLQQDKTPPSKMISRSANLQTSQTWNRLTDTRILGSFQWGEGSRSQTGSAGISQWFWQESIQASLDISRTLSLKTPSEFLDLDSEVVTLPPKISSTGYAMSLKHLATPTTITQYSYTHIVATDRPPADIYQVLLKQHLYYWDGAMHLSVQRGINKGRIATTTSYGQVSSIEGQAAYLQSLWKGARGRVAYRYYKEDEVQRAYGDELVYGSDTVSLNIAQELPKGSIDSIAMPLVFEGGAAYYQTNTKLSAKVYEAGLSARF